MGLFASPKPQNPSFFKERIINYMMMMIITKVFGGWLAGENF
jgi:hypothetical protein